MSFEATLNVLNAHHVFLASGGTVEQLIQLIRVNQPSSSNASSSNAAGPSFSTKTHKELEERLAKAEAKTQAFEKIHRYTATDRVTELKKELTVYEHTVKKIQGRIACIDYLLPILEKNVKEGLLIVKSCPELSNIPLAHSEAYKTMIGCTPNTCQSKITEIITCLVQRRDSEEKSCDGSKKICENLKEELKEYEELLAAL